MAENQLQQIGSTKYYNWFSENAFIGPEWSYQYAENCNVRDDISWIQLSSLPEQRSASTFPSASTQITAYCVIQDAAVQTLVTFYTWGANNPFTTRVNSDRPTETTRGNTGTANVSHAVRFWELNAWVREQRIFAFTPNTIYIINTATWASTTVNPSDTIDWVTEQWSTNAAGRVTPLVYSNSVVIVWHWNTLRRYVPVASAELPVWWSIIRKYKANDQIIWLTLEWNYLKVIISDGGINTITYYIQGTFDVEDGWVVESIDRDNMLGLNTTTLENMDYYMMRSADDSPVLYMYRLNGYTKEKVFRTMWANGQANQLEYFTLASTSTYDSEFPVKRGIMYVPTGDGVWTFWMNKLWQFIVNKDWTLWWSRQARRRVILWDYLYVYYAVAWTDVEVRYYIEYRNNGYTEQWLIIDRIFTGGAVGEWKENVQMNIGYELDYTSWDPGSIDIYVRPNRIDRTVAGGRSFVWSITDKTSMVHEVYLSTENFRKDWNCIEYKLVKNRWADTKVSPMVYDVWLFYSPIERDTWVVQS